MRIIAFLTDAGAVCEILTHLGEPTSPLRLMRARAPPVWERQGATLGEDGPWLSRRLNTNSNAALPGRCWGSMQALSGRNSEDFSGARGTNLEN